MSVRNIIKSVLFIAFLLGTAQSQINWEKYFGGKEYDFGMQLIELSDKNLLICGYTYSFGPGEGDAWLIKVTPSGDTLWSKTYGGKSYECATSVHEMPNGNLVVAGCTKSFAKDSVNCAYDLWLLYLSPRGDTIWTRTFPGSNTAEVKMAVDNQNNIILAGNSIAKDINQDIQIVKVTSEGKTVWTKIYGGADREDMNGFCTTSDGSMLLLSTSQSFGGKTMWLFKCTSSGDTLWSKQYGNFNYGNGSDVFEMPDGTYMLSSTIGSSQSSLNLLNLKRDGTVNWEKSYPQFTSNYRPVFHPLSSGNFFVSMIEEDNQESGRKIRLVRLDNTGTVLWSDLTGNWSEFNYADDFLESSTGAFYMLGTTNKITKAADDIWLVSLTPDMYVTLGGTIEYHLVQSADSSKNSYQLVRGPEQMTVSSGGTVQWKPQTAAISSELVEVAIKSATATDTVGFVVHVNKNGVGIAGQTVAPVDKRMLGSAIEVYASKTRALFISTYAVYRVDIFTVHGKKIVSLTGDHLSPVTWNFADASGRPVQAGRYVIRLASGKNVATASFSVVR